jgi:hypothetical protein
VPLDDFRPSEQRDYCRSVQASLSSLALFSTRLAAEARSVFAYLARTMLGHGIPASVPLSALDRVFSASFPSIFRQEPSHNPRMCAFVRIRAVMRRKKNSAKNEPEKRPAPQKSNNPIIQQSNPYA